MPIRSRHEDTLTFWVGLDARLIPPDEFQADSPKIQVSRGQPLKMRAPRRLSENSGRFGVHGLDLWCRDPRQKYDEVAAKNLQGILPDDMKPRT